MFTPDRIISRRRAFGSIAAAAVVPLLLSPAETGYPLTPRSDLRLEDTTFMFAHGLGAGPNSAWIPGAAGRLVEAGAKKVKRLVLPLSGVISIAECRSVIDSAMDGVDGPLVAIGWSGGGRVLLDRLARTGRPVDGLLLTATRMVRDTNGVGVGRMFRPDDVRYGLYQDDLPDDDIQSRIDGNAVVMHAPNDGQVDPSNARPLSDTTRAHIHWVDNQGHCDNPLLAPYMYQVIVQEIMQGKHVYHQPEF